MQILLPPSEGKAEPEGGEPVDLGSLVFADELSKKRRELIRAFDRKLLKAPAAPAAAVYTGVLYGRLDLGRLPAAARRRAAKRVLIASALWGFVRLEDRLPYYKLPPSTKLDGIGPLAAWWREALAAAMPDAAGETIVDMRSGAYQAMWKPKQATLLAVRAFREEKGKRKAVSHMAKAVRGDVARALLLAKREPKTPGEVAAVAADAGFEVELTPASLDVIVDI
ncbi:MAG TPA: peroxide stress protein YaaA [Solirubrobacterales bacterium]|nr:peroxide stress protein YaaA [Solirubrobacterales bacterium]